MIIHEGYKNLTLRNPVVTLGIFDGVHKGHRKLLDQLVLRANSTGGESVVITFNPHPRFILEKETDRNFCLSTLEEKTRHIENAGIDHLIIVEFTERFRRMKACDFVREVLMGEIGSSYLIVGHDHHFGYSGEGNYDTITECARSSDLRVERVEGFKTGNKTVSSSLIREALQKGDLDDANEWLGYCYSLKGRVIKGKGLGRKLGFPTANIDPGDINKIVPGDGVYAVEIILDGRKYNGMLSTGKNPTVSKTIATRSIEVNIFDFTGNIYGKEIEIIFRYRIRDEIRFNNISELSVQIEKDRLRTLQLLK